MTDMLASIDPGVNGAGLAIWDGRELIRACYVSPMPFCRPDRLCRVAYQTEIEISRTTVDVLPRVIELPRVYPGARKNDPNDLVDLACVAGALGNEFTEYVYPRTWKGQVPKVVMGKRIMSRLSEGEKWNIEKCPESLKHNVLDAIGIGLWKLGRLS